MFNIFYNSESIYPEIETTTLPSTTTTTTEKIAKEKEVEDHAEQVVTPDRKNTKKNTSLMKEMKGFLRIIQKFTNTSDLPNDPEIDQMDFRIRSVSLITHNLQT